MEKFGTRHCQKLGYQYDE